MREGAGGKAIIFHSTCVRRCAREVLSTGNVINACTSSHSVNQVSFAAQLIVCIRTGSARSSHWKESVCMTKKRMCLSYVLYSICARTLHWYTASANIALTHDIQKVSIHTHKPVSRLLSYKGNFIAPSTWLDSYLDPAGQGSLEGPVDRCMDGTRAESMQFNRRGACHGEMDNFATQHQI